MCGRIQVAFQAFGVSAAERDCQQRPAVGAAAPPFRGPDAGELLRRDVLTPPPERATIFPRECVA